MELKSLELGLPKLCKCICPDCKTLHNELVEKEYTDNPFAWYIDSHPVILCTSCRVSRLPYRRGLE